jgi:6-pyruvoyltetrahydropterin/6-carboxytetrahydropterin synthase
MSDHLSQDELSSPRACCDRPLPVAALHSRRPYVVVCRRATFSAAHHYYLDDWSEAENQRVFGACSNRYGHGHNYVLEVAVAGPLDPETGMVVNLKDLKVVIDEEVIAPLDHQYLNHQVEAFKGQIPTLENIAAFLWQRLLPRMRSLGLTLYRLKVIENETLFVETFNPALHRRPGQRLPLSMAVPTSPQRLAIDPLTLDSSLPDAPLPAVVAASSPL